MSIGDWLITLIIIAIPLVGFVMLLVWAFDSNTNPSKSNYAKARLIFSLLAGVVTTIVAVIILLIIGASGQAVEPFIYSIF